MLRQSIDKYVHIKRNVMWAEGFIVKMYYTKGTVIYIDKNCK